MARVYIGIGSNIERKKHIRAALDALSGAFGQLQLSSVYESKAVGFEGDNFYNLVAAFDTHLGVGELAWQLRKIEYTYGRRLCEPKCGSRKLDLDILTYADLVGEFSGNLLPRSDIVKYAHVLRPLAEIAPDEIHPKLRKSYRALWDRYDQSRQRLWSVEDVWSGEGHSSTTPQQNLPPVRAPSAIGTI